MVPVTRAARGALAAGAALTLAAASLVVRPDAARAQAPAAAPAAAPDDASAYVPLDDIAYAYIDALMARGALRRLSALERPYTVAAIRRALAAPDGDAAGGARGSLAAALLDAIARYDPAPAPDAGAPDDGVAVLAGVTPFATAQSSARRDLMLPDTVNGAYPGLAMRFALATRRVVAATRILADDRLKHDPEFTGRKNRSIAGRTEDAYLSAQWRYGELFFGRIARNWGPTSVQGLQLGHYAYTYDQLQARLGTSALHLTSVLARLDDARLNADTTMQRWLAVHRLAGRWRDVELGLAESMLFGRTTGGLDLAYANPLNFYDLSQYNEGQSGNVSYAADAAWRSPVGTFSGQFLLDDIQIDHCDSGCKEPPSYAWSATAEGIPLAGPARAFASYVKVTNLTYRTPQPWERYAWLGVGLGAGFSDFDELRGGVDVVVPRTTLRIYGAFRRQGEGDYREPYPKVADYPTTPTFLSGIVTHITRFAVSGATSWRDVIDITGDVGVDRLTNADHVQGSTRSEFEGRVRASVPLSHFTLRHRLH